MSSKRQKKLQRKKSRDLATQLAKKAAREQVGIPPPTRVRQSKKGGKGKRFREAEPSKKEEFLNIYEPPEEQSATYVSSLRLRPYVATQRNSFRNIMSNVPVLTYSKEMLIHANYLRETKGEKQMNEYLNNQKPSTSTIQGPIESALKDAEEKQKYYTQQVSVAQVESQRWGQIAEGLRRALGLVTGTPATSEKTKREGGTRVGKWGNFIIETLTSENKPFTRTGLRDKAIAEFPEKSKNTLEVGINSNLRALLERGTIVEKNGEFHLPNWDEMTKQTQEEKVA